MTYAMFAVARTSRRRTGVPSALTARRAAPTSAFPLQELRNETTRPRRRHRRRRPDRLQPAVPHRRRRHARQGPAGDPAAARVADRQGAGRAEGRDDGARGLRVPAARRHAAAPPTRRSRSRTPTSRCWSARGRAARAWSARTCCSRTRRSSSSRARRSTPSASRDIKVLVVGNPANTNAYIAMKSAPSLPKKNFTAMLRLDHNRALSQLAAKSGKPVGSIEKLIVWGNHSPTMYPDYRFATADGQSLKDADQRRELEPQRVPAHRRQARRRDHRGARPVVGRVRRQRRDRPRARLDARQQRQVGDDGRRLRRQLRHPAGRDVRRARHTASRRIHARRGT